MRASPRRPLVAVIGDSKLDQDDVKVGIAQELGRRLVDAGCRVITGGLGGVMAAAMEGARQSATYSDGDTVAVLPGHDPADAADSADIVIATGLGLARNIIVANADAVIAIGGGAGTLSEIALAWQLRRPVVGIAVDGWSLKASGTRIDHRQRQPDIDNDRVFPAADAADAVRIILEVLPRYSKRMRYV